MGIDTCACASFLSGDTLDTVEDYLAIFVIFLAPVVGVVMFRPVHMLPEIVRTAIRKVLQPFAAAAALSVAGVALPPSAHASFLPPEMMDSAAMGIAWFVVCIIPIGGIVLFWLVHVLPEKIAHKRHHPQQDAIHTLCLLSLVFGGLLWPIAWLWAYTKPIGYRAAYGTDKHENYYDEMAEKHRAGKLLREDLYHLREDLEAMEARGALPPKLRALKDELVSLRREDAERAAAAVERTPPPAENEKGQA